MDADERYSRLQYMLDKSRIYATLLKERMDQARKNMECKENIDPPSTASSGRAKGKQRPASGKHEEPPSKRTKAGDATGEEKLPPIEQPRLVTGTKLKDYQLEGLAWMASLYENGISGILGMRNYSGGLMCADYSHSR